MKKGHLFCNRTCLMYLFAFLFASASLQATDYYVNPGDDISNIINNIPAGNHTVHIAAGTYQLLNNSRIVVPQGVDIIGAGPDQTFITGTGNFHEDVAMALKANYNNTDTSKLQGFTIYADEFSSSADLRYGISVEKRHNVEISNVHLKDFYQVGIRVRGDYIDEQGKELSTITTWIDGLKIYNCYIENSGNTTRNLNDSGCWQYYQWTGAIDLSATREALIHDNIIKVDNPWNGSCIRSFYGLGYGIGNKIYNNQLLASDHFLDPGECGTRQWPAAAAIEVASWRETECYNNLITSWTSWVHDYEGMGGDFGVHFHHNRVVYGDSAQAGEAIEPARDMIIHDNEFLNLYSNVIGSNAQPPQNTDPPIAGPSNIQFYRNIVTLTESELQAGDRSKVVDAIRIQGRAKFEDWKIYNNVFVNYRAILLSLAERENYGARTGFHFANNVFLNVNYLTHTSYTKWGWGEPAVFENNILYGWQDSFYSNWTPDHFGNPGNMPVTLINNLGTDAAPGINPGLLLSGNIPDPYYRPKDETSPVVNAGIDILGFTDYAIGQPDIGRYEFSSLPVYSLTVFNRGGGAVKPSSTVEIPQGNAVTIIAVPNKGYSFDKWEGTSEEEDTIIISMEKDTALTALFKPKTYIVSAISSPLAGGAVSIDPLLSEYEHGTVITVVASSENGYLFNGWNVPGETTTTFVITVEKDMEIIANFTANSSSEQRFEAELASFTNSSVASYVNASNGQYLNCDEGSVITWTYNAASAKDYELQFSVTPYFGTRSLGLFVNNVKIGVVTSSATQYNFEEITFPTVALNAGENTIQLKDSEGTAEPHVDYLDVIGGIPPTTYKLSTSTGTGGFVTPFGENSYYLNDTVKITAIAETGYSFTGWEGITEASNIISVIMNKDTSFAAMFSPEYYALNISAGNGGSVSPAGNSFHPYGELLQIVAIPDAGYKFNGWTGSSETNDTLLISITKDLSLKANFVMAKYTLTASDANGKLTVDPLPLNGKYSFGTEVTVTATPDEGYVFSGWGGDLSGTENPTTLTMDADENIMANFRAIPVYNVSILYGLGGIVIPFGSNMKYDSAQVVKIIAIPSSGNVFSHWTGSSETNDTIYVTVDQDMELVAYFKEASKLTLIVNATNGSVTLNPAGGIHVVGTIIQATAVADSGYQFSGWTGDVSGNANPISLTMDVNKSITANFTTVSATTKNRITGIVVYPNPVQNGWLTISTVNTTSEMKISITDLSGRVVLYEKPSSDNKLNVQRLNKGIYLLSVETGSKVHIEKLVVK